MHLWIWARSAGAVLACLPMFCLHTYCTCVCLSASVCATTSDSLSFQGPSHGCHRECRFSTTKQPELIMQTQKSWLHRMEIWIIQWGGDIHTTAFRRHLTARTAHSTCVAMRREYFKEPYGSQACTQKIIMSHSTEHQIKAKALSIWPHMRVWGKCLNYVITPFAPAYLSEFRRTFILWATEEVVGVLKTTGEGKVSLVALISIMTHFFFVER